LALFSSSVGDVFSQIWVPRRYAASAAIGAQVGNALGSFRDYNAIRTGQKMQMAALEGQIARTTDEGERSSLEAELKYWRNVDSYARSSEKMALQAWGIQAEDFDQVKMAILDYLERPEYYKAEITKMKKVNDAMVHAARYLEHVEEMTSMDAVKKARDLAPELLRQSEVARPFCYRMSKDPDFLAEIQALESEGKIDKCQPFQFAMAYTDPFSNMRLQGDTLKTTKWIEEVRTQIAKLEPELATLTARRDAMEPEVKAADAARQQLNTEYNALRYREKGSPPEEERKRLMAEKYQALQQAAERDAPRGREYMRLSTDVTRLNERREFLRGKVTTAEARMIYHGVDTSLIATIPTPTPQETDEWDKVPPDTTPPPSTTAGGTLQADGFRKPASAPAVVTGRLDEAGIIALMKAGIAEGKMDEVTTEMVDTWEAKPDEEYNGEKFQIGTIRYSRDTVFGKKPFGAKARIQNGSIVRWVKDGR
jgi:outer membrane murein-binding lipoprotein Lpp